MQVTNVPSLRVAFSPDGKSVAVMQVVPGGTGWQIAIIPVDNSKVEGSNIARSNANGSNITGSNSGASNIACSNIAGLTDTKLSYSKFPRLEGLRELVGI